MSDAMRMDLPVKISLETAIAAARQYETTIEWVTSLGTHCKAFPNGEVIGYAGGLWRTLLGPGTAASLAKAEADRRAEEDAADEDHGTTWRTRPAAKQGTHDWSQQPRTMVDELEGDDPHTFGNLLTAFALAFMMLVFFAFAVLGAIAFAHAFRHAMASGWSWSTFFEAIGFHS